MHRAHIRTSAPCSHTPTCTVQAYAHVHRARIRPRAPCTYTPTCTVHAYAHVHRAHIRARRQAYVLLCNMQHSIVGFTCGIHVKKTNPVFGGTSLRNRRHPMGEGEWREGEKGWGGVEGGRMGRGYLRSLPPPACRRWKAESPSDSPSQV